MAQLSLRKEVVLVGFDLLACFLFAVGAVYFRFGGEPPYKHLLTLYVSVPVLLVWRLSVAYTAGLYDFHHRVTAADHAFAGLGAAAVGVFGGLAGLALARLYWMSWVEFSRLAAVYETLGLMTWFTVSRAATLQLLYRTGWRVRTLVVGEGADRLGREIECHAPRLVCVERLALPAGTQVLPGQLREALETSRPDHVLLLEGALKQESLAELLAACDREPVDVYLYPSLGPSALAYTNVASLAGVPVISLQPAIRFRAYHVVKRGLDVSVALAGCLVMAPVVAILAIAIPRETPGRLFFVQERLGQGGEPFDLYKFRTMRDNAEQETGPVLTEPGDVRVTRLGRFLRRTRLDELPQLFNVLRGDMSLVGPRPERRAFADTFEKENPLYRRRLAVRPGMTGLAQIHGRYDTDYEHKLRYDLVYINSISFRTDLRILLATVRTVLTGKGAI